MAASHGNELPDRELESVSPRRGRPLRAVVDSCVFARRDWIEPIVLAARAGYVVPIWSPCIIEEASRLLTWLWLKKHAGDSLSESVRRRHSREAHKWFGVMTAVFQVVDDRPPAEPMWTATPADEWDIPLWNAAVRGRAQVIVTENLKDGPPVDETGLQRHRGVAFVSPALFRLILEAWADFCETGDSRSLKVKLRPRPHQPGATAVEGGERAGTLHPLDQADSESEIEQAVEGDEPVETLHPELEALLERLSSEEPDLPSPEAQTQ